MYYGNWENREKRGKKRGGKSIISVTAQLDTLHQRTAQIFLYFLGLFFPLEKQTKCNWKERILLSISRDHVRAHKGCWSQVVIIWLLEMVWFNLEISIHNTKAQSKADAISLRWLDWAMWYQLLYFWFEAHPLIWLICAIRSPCLNN